MLRTRKRDVNVKPNRRLDRKSSRGMIYENEELRLRTININAEVEKSQSVIKKLKNENDQLKKEIFYLRYEYDKLDKILKSKSENDDSSCSSEQESIESLCNSCDSETEETSQNNENVEKISNRQNLHKDIERLSIVSEEKSEMDNYFFDESQTTTISANTQNYLMTNDSNDIIRPDQSYPTAYIKQNGECFNRYNVENQKHLPSSHPKHFFSPLPLKKNLENTYALKTGPDIYVDQTSSSLTPLAPVQIQSFGSQNLDINSLIPNQTHCFEPLNSTSSNTAAFQNGGNLDELLKDMLTVSHDIYQLSAQKSAENKFPKTFPDNDDILDGQQNYVKVGMTTENAFQETEKPFKSELNVVLMPNPMPLIGFEKYKIHSNPDISFSAFDNPNFCPVTKQNNHQNNFLNNNEFSNSLNSLNLGVNSQYFNSTVCQRCFCQMPYVSEQMQTNACCSDCTAIQNQSEIIVVENETAGTSASIGITSKITNQTEDVSTDTMATPNLARKITTISESTETQKSTESTTKDDHTLNIDEGNVDKTSSSDDKAIKTVENAPKSPGKNRKVRKLSIHFNGNKKEKMNRSLSVDSGGKNAEKKIIDLGKVIKNSDTTNKTNLDVAETQSVTKDGAETNEKKHVTIEKQKSAEGEQKKHRSHSTTGEHCKRRRKSSKLQGGRGSRLSHDWGGGHSKYYDEFTTSLSERERTNSLTSDESLRNSSTRALANIPNMGSGGKVPWCGCWGNGCL